MAARSMACDRLRSRDRLHCSGCPVQLIEAFKAHLNDFRGQRERFDDETLLAIQYAPGAGHSHSAVV